MRWTTFWWPQIKETGLWVLGVFAIASQVISAHPNGYVIGAGLALTVPSVADHVRALLPRRQRIIVLAVTAAAWAAAIAALAAGGARW